MSVLNPHVAWLPLAAMWHVGLAHSCTSHSMYDSNTTDIGTAKQKRHVGESVAS